MEPGTDLLQAGMDERTEAVWDAMRAAYSSGLLDEAVGLVGALLPPDTDQIEMMGEVEEIMMRADLAAVAGILDQALVPLARALAQEEAVEAMKSLLLTFRPAIEAVVAASGGDMAALGHKVRTVLEALPALRPFARAAAPAAIQAVSPQIEVFLRDRAGTLVGSAINAQCIAINRLDQTNPRVLSVFLESASEAIDTAELKKAASVLFGILLEHRPRVMRFLAREVATRLRKLLGVTEEGGGR